MRDVKAEAAVAVQSGEVVQGEQIVDLTARMGADGQLAWEVPEGEWTILRVGFTPNGRNNHPAPAEGTGLECDKLSKEAAQAHWDGSFAGLWRGPAALATPPRPGDGGPAVAWLWQRLQPEAMPATPRYDHTLREAVRTLQVARGLPADGVAGSLTLMALANDQPGPRLMRTLD